MEPCSGTGRQTHSRALNTDVMYHTQHAPNCMRYTYFTLVSGILCINECYFHSTTGYGSMRKHDYPPFLT